MNGHPNYEPISMKLSNPPLKPSLLVASAKALRLFHLEDFQLQCNDDLLVAQFMDCLTS